MPSVAEVANSPESFQPALVPIFARCRAQFANPLSRDIDRFLPEDEQWTIEECNDIIDGIGTPTMVGEPQFFCAFQVRMIVSALL